jgi:predicted short-subunit dehydrogenase-like oxidoreductase (DUF2520 family)
VSQAHPRVAIIGAGRLGTGLTRALEGAGCSVALLGREAGSWGRGIADRELLLLAVPDDAIGEVAEQLAGVGELGTDLVVLHTSGARDRGVLAPLIGRVGGLGSFAPAQTIADPATAAERLRGAYAVLEGDPVAIAAGKRLAAALGMHPAEVPARAKPAYHAGATMVANLGVGLAGMAARVAWEGGVPAELASQIYLPLWRGAVANVEVMGAVAALTGPVRRGDVETIRRHLALLEGEVRSTYVTLSLEALRLARAAGLEESKAAAVEAMLRPASAG